MANKLDAAIPRKDMTINEDDTTQATNSRCSASAGYALSDATKGRLSMKGQALLQWGWDGQFYDHSIQMPEKVVDEILAGRDALHNTEDSRAKGVG